MSGSGACARDGNMWQRGQVVHGKAQAIDVRSKLAVCDTPAAAQRHFGLRTI